MNPPDPSVLDVLILVGGLSAIGLVTLFIVFLLIKLSSDWQRQGLPWRRANRKPMVSGHTITPQEYRVLRQLLEREIKGSISAAATLRRPVDRQACLNLQKKLDRQFGIETPFNAEETWAAVRQLWEKTDKYP